MSGEPINPIIIDIEASGFGRGSYPIEVGFAMPDGTTHCSLIRPQDDWIHWSEAAYAVHRVARKHLFVHGRQIKEIATWLNDMLKGQQVYSDAWSHDISWLGKLFDAADIPQQFKIESLMVLLDEQQLDQWNKAKDSIEANNKTIRHRASADALLIQQTYACLNGLNTSPNSY